MPDVKLTDDTVTVRLSVAEKVTGKRRDLSVPISAGRDRQVVADGLQVRFTREGQTVMVGRGLALAVTETCRQSRPCATSSSASASPTAGVQPQPWARSARTRPVQASALSHTGETPTARVTVS